jgi:hypothetical protein
LTVQIGRFAVLRALQSIFHRSNPVFARSFAGRRETGIRLFRGVEHGAVCVRIFIYTINSLKDWLRLNLLVNGSAIDERSITACGSIFGALSARVF